MSKKRFKLIRNYEDGSRYLFAYIDVDDKCCGIHCYRAYSWICDKELNLDTTEFEFVAEAACKPDSCTHWYFNGQDYDPESKSEDNVDAYYHICGTHCLEDMMYCMLFMWEVAARVNGRKYPTWSEKEYRDNEYINKLLDDMFIPSDCGGYPIAKFEILEEELE